MHITTRGHLVSFVALLAALLLLTACGGGGSGGAELALTEADCGLLSADDLPGFDQAEIQLAEVDGFGDLTCDYVLGGANSVFVGVITALIAADRESDEAALNNSWEPGPALGDLSLYNPATGQLRVWVTADGPVVSVSAAPAAGPAEARPLAEAAAATFVPELQTRIGAE